MQIKNTVQQFGSMAIGLHWILAALMIALLVLGFYMVSLPLGLEKLKLYGWHKEYGFLVLFLAIFRLFWRLTHVLPELTIPWIEKVAARSMHWLFYGFMFAMPITGWLITSAAGLPASFFGLFTLPSLIAPDAQLLACFESVHKYLAYVLIAAICLHTAAALKHHFINKDDILRRMLP